MPKRKFFEGVMQKPAYNLPEAEVAQKPGRVIAPLILAGLLFSVGALALFAWLAHEVFEGELARFDRAVRAHVHSVATPALTVWMQGVSFFGSVLFLTSASVALCLVFVAIRWRRAAVWLALDMVGAGLLDVILKQVFHRARPEAFFGTEPHSYSFPSGHALASLCFYWALAGLLSARLANQAARAILWVAAVVIVAAIGVSRIYLGVHYPTDVIAGYLAAAVWVGALLFVDQLESRPRRTTRNGQLVRPEVE